MPYVSQKWRVSPVRNALESSPIQNQKGWTNVLKDEGRLILDLEHHQAKHEPQRRGQKRALVKVSKTCTRHKNGTPSWSLMLQDEAARGTFRWFITATSKLEKGSRIPNLVKRHLYRGTEQPSKELHTLSVEPTGRITQSGVLPTVMLAWVTTSTVFITEGVLTIAVATQWYLLALVDSINRIPLRANTSTQWWSPRLT